MLFMINSHLGHWRHHFWHPLQILFRCVWPCFCLCEVAKCSVLKLSDLSQSTKSVWSKFNPLNEDLFEMHLSSKPQEWSFISIGHSSRCLYPLQTLPQYIFRSNLALRSTENRQLVHFSQNPRLLAQNKWVGEIKRTGTPEDPRNFQNNIPPCRLPAASHHIATPTQITTRAQKSTGRRIWTTDDERFSSWGNVRCCSSPRAIITQKFWEQMSNQVIKQQKSVTLST